MTQLALFPEPNLGDYLKALQCWQAYCRTEEIRLRHKEIMLRHYPEGLPPSEVAADAAWKTRNEEFLARFDMLVRSFS